MKPGTVTETTLLVIGYGNTLRSDDAAGPLVAEQIGTLGIPGVRALACPQLSPELAAELAEAVSVVFVDATTDTTREVQLEPLVPAESGQVSTHGADPRALLAMAQNVYGTAPAGWLLKVPAENFAHGEGLSAVTRRGVEAAVGAIRTLVAEWMF
jgi:hydrogenase maturation protease